MAFGFKRRNYVAVLVTLATPDTNYNIFELVNTVLAGESGTAANMQVPGTARELAITAYNGIDGVGGNNKDILIGDGFLSTSRMGYVLSPAQSRTYRAGVSDVPFAEFYARSAGTNQKLMVEVTTF